MTVSQDILKSGPYNTDGVTKAFAVTFQYLEDTDIVVTLLNTTTGATVVGVLNTDYTVVDNVSPIIGGTVTIANNGFGGIAGATGLIVAGYTITFNPSIPILQGESYPNAGLFPSAAVEQALDRLTLICQGLQLATSESLKYPVTDSSTISNVLPSSTLRANLFLAFDGLGNPIALGTSGSTSVSPAMVPVVQATTTMVAAELLLNGNIPSLARAVTDSNVFAAFTANANSFVQQTIQNTNNGATASADIVVENNQSTATTFYGNFGINSSGFTGAGSFNISNAVYLTATSGELVIGTTTSNGIHFVQNGSATDAAYIDSFGFHVVNPTGAAADQVANIGTLFGFAKGFVNKFRNPGMNVAQRGASGTSNGGYTVDGWQIAVGGTNITWAQVQNIALPSGGIAANGIKLTGATSNTDTQFIQKIESSVSAPLAGQRVTVQFTIKNNTGGTLNPTLTTRYPTVVDNWGASTNDVAGVSLQPITNGVTAVVAYTFTASTNADLGYQVLLDFSAALNSGASNFTITNADIRVTPGVSGGLNSAPPNPEIPVITADLLLCQRYFEKSYNQSVAPGTAFTAGQGSMIFGALNGSLTWATTVFFKATKRAAPTILTYDHTGASGGADFYNGTTYVTGGTVTITKAGDSGFAIGATGNVTTLNYEYSASAEL